MQANLAIKEIEQMERQILSAGIRVQVAEKDLENHKMQIENASRLENYLKDKFTSKEFYGWMKDQLTNLHKQSYDLPFEMAKKAEMAFEFEKGATDTVLINYNYWDNSRYGLLAGEKLQLALRKLETAYQEENTRQFELTQHISLKAINPEEFLKLRETGQCNFELFEELFELDYPGHYNRRIKSVSISIPCVVGPYTSISATLRLTKNQVRIFPDATSDYNDRDSFIGKDTPVSTIATSAAQQDSGVFELNFRDERYLLFEFSGALSNWSFKLFHDAADIDGYGKSLRQFNYDTIGDVIIHFRYTAQESDNLKAPAIANLRSNLGSTNWMTTSMIDLKTTFSTEWHKFLNPVDASEGNILNIRFRKNLLPYRDSSQDLVITEVTFVAEAPPGNQYQVSLNIPSGEAGNIELVSDTLGSLHVGQIESLTIPFYLVDDEETLWNIRFEKTGGELLQTNELKNMYLVFGYRRV